MSHSSARRPPKPLDPAALEALALRYVGRYATTRAKLRTYLHRKVKERGWGEETAPPTETIIERFVDLGYVDDRAFAEMRGAALSRRGFGKRRVSEALRCAGVAPDDAAEAFEAAGGDQGWNALIALARRRRIGPFAPMTEDRDSQRKTVAILVRAGHEYASVRRLLALSPDEMAELNRM